MNDLDQLVRCASRLRAGAHAGGAGEREGALPRQVRPRDRAAEGARRAVARREEGARRAINAAKQQVEGALNARRQALADAELEAQLQAEALDVTLPGRSAAAARAPDHAHDGAHRADLRLDGLRRRRRPEIETDWMSFTALNNPENHPARSMQDTFYVDMKDAEGRWLNLRPHTSPMQMRYARAHARKHAGAARCPTSASSRRAAPTASTATRRTRRCSTRSKACGSART
jgi:phenylalanyl-tRNA synthetase alpha chain